MTRRGGGSGTVWERLPHLADTVIAVRGQRNFKYYTVKIRTAAPYFNATFLTKRRMTSALLNKDLLIQLNALWEPQM